MAEVQLVGQKIKEIRMMKKSEIISAFGEDMGDEKSAVIILENGAKLFASQDYEGNGQGAIFGQKGNDNFVVYVD